LGLAEIFNVALQQRPRCATCDAYRMSGEERGGEADPGAELVARELGLATPNLDCLESRLSADYHVDDWGLRVFGGVADEVARAVASDLVVSSVLGAKVALRDVALRQRQHADLVGPNGRTMPRPGVLDDYMVLVESEACITDCLRAIGTALDCIVAVSVLLIGVPKEVQRAEGSWLLASLDAKAQIPTDQRAAWNIVVRDVSAEGDRPAKGWLAWALETRNAVIHRAPLLHVWLNRPGRRPGGRQLFVRTAEQPAHLMRMEPHMRREPWLPDMHALSEAGLAAADLWLPEPTQNTLGHLKNGAVRVLECVANDLLELWGTSMPAFSWPVDAWKLERRDHSRRVQLAAQFEGFEQNYPTPPPSTMHAHPHTSARAVLSDGVRARQASQPGST